jgi:hypothetical protein
MFTSPPSDTDKLKKDMRRVFADLKGGSDGQLPISEFGVEDYTEYLPLLSTYVAPTFLPFRVVLTTVDQSELDKKCLAELCRKHNKTEEEIYDDLSIILKDEYKKYLENFLKDISDKNNNAAVIVKVKSDSSQPEAFTVYGKRTTGWALTQLSKSATNSFNNIFKDLGITKEKPLVILDSESKDRKHVNAINIIREHIINAHKVKQTKLEAQTDPYVISLIERIEKLDQARGGASRSSMSFKAILKADSKTAVGRKLALKATPSNVEAAKSPEEQDKKYIEEADKLLTKGSAECYGFALLAYAAVRKAFPDVRVQFVNEGVHNFLIIGYTGNEKPINMENLKKEAKNVLIVDLWTLAMGVNSVPENGKTKPSHGVYSLSQYSAFDLKSPHTVFDTRPFQKAPAPRFEG